MDGRFGQSKAFHGLATFVLVFCSGTAALLFFFHIAPGLEVWWEGRSLNIRFPPIPASVLRAFALLTLVALGVLIWRLWVRYLGPWLRREEAA